MNETEAHQAARILPEEHGTAALDHALARLHAHCAVGDMEGCAAWSRVLAAMNRLRLRSRSELPTGDHR